jgi:hypothetical protein
MLGTESSSPTTSNRPTHSLTKLKFRQGTSQDLESTAKMRNATKFQSHSRLHLELGCKKEARTYELLG